MIRSCPNCGATAIPDARYCRQCGAPLRAANTDDDTPVSPMASTVPLSDLGRATDGLPGNDPQRPSSETTRINRTEIDELLHYPRRGPALDPQATLVSGQINPATEDERAAPSPTSAFSSPETGPASESRPGVPPAFSNDEELTIPAVRRGTAAARLPDTGPLTDAPVSAPPTPDGAPSPAAPPAARPSRAHSLWPLAVAACLFVLSGIALAAVWLAVRSARRPAETSANVVSSATTDPEQLFRAKLSEAQTLLASGDRSGAIASLREAIKLDPSSATAHRLLGDLLVQSGAGAEAITEYRAIVENDPNDAAGWRALASTQAAEGLYRDAAESYRRLIDIAGGSSADGRLQLDYADALLHAGQTEEARVIYQKMAAEVSPEIAGLARQRLAELAPAQAKASPSASRDTRLTTADQARAGDESALRASPTPTPASPASTPSVATVKPALSPSEHYARGVALWPSNRAAAIAEFRAAAGGGNADADYYLGLSIAEGHDPRTLGRAELLTALGYFQQARAHSEKFRAQARSYEDQLGQEYDRRRGQK